MPDVHARLSASGAKCWMSCPPSVRLEEQFPESTSEYAEEGTFAHGMAELILRYNNGEITKKTFTTRMNKLKADKFYSQEMLDYIEDYAKSVWEIVNEARAACPDALVLFEQRLDFSEYVPEGFGTGDVVIVADDMVNIIDLKYGKGVGVSAVDNPQLRLYEIGAYLEHSMLYNIKRIRMTIIQPRLENVSIEEMEAEELMQWAETEVKPKARMAMDGIGEFTVGCHCQFCKARKTCKARADYNLELAKYEFEDPALLTSTDIADILGRADELAHWVKDVSEYALEQALKGEKFDGWKLVEGMSRRKYSDQEAVREVLVNAGFLPHKICKPEELIGLTDMAKLVGKKQFEELLGTLIIKPEGKPTLVPVTDKHPALSTADSAVEDFEDTFGDELYNCRQELLLLEAIPPYKPLDHYLLNMKDKYKEETIRKAYSEVVK